MNTFWEASLDEEAVSWSNEGHPAEAASSKILAFVRMPSGRRLSAPAKRHKRAACGQLSSLVVQNVKRQRRRQIQQHDKKATART